MCICVFVFLPLYLWGQLFLHKDPITFSPQQCVRVLYLYQRRPSASQSLPGKGREAEWRADMGVAINSLQEEMR